MRAVLIGWARYQYFYIFKLGVSQSAESACVCVLQSVKILLRVSSTLMRIEFIEPHLNKVHLLWANGRSIFIQ